MSKNQKERLKRQLSPATSEQIKAIATLRYRIAVAERVLQEYAWREGELETSDVHPLSIEALVYCIAGECRSEIGFAIHSYLADLSPDARKTIFVILLAIAENIPAKLPRLHTLKPPKRGTYPDAWLNWTIERVL
jgi:hypothetical protein